MNKPSWCWGWTALCVQCCVSCCVLFCVCFWALPAVAQPTPAQPVPTPPAPKLPALSTDAVALVADSAIGAPFWPGHARWGVAERQPSACRSANPDWHVGLNGSDGAGLVAKAWQVPVAADPADDVHPYGPLQFWMPHALWQDVARADWRRGDALVHPSLTPGSVQLLDQIDDWGQAVVWRCVDCALGCQLAVTPLGPSWQGRRRHDLLDSAAWLQAGAATGNPCPAAPFDAAPLVAASFDAGPADAACAVAASADAAHEHAAHEHAAHEHAALRLDLPEQPRKIRFSLPVGARYGPAHRTRQSSTPQKSR